MAKHILAIDAGTTAITCLVLDKQRAVVGRAHAEFTQHYPQAGWVEHDAVEIFDVTVRTATAAIEDAGLAGKDVAAIGITNQRETTVVWDRATGTPIHRAIVWQDRRTEGACAKLRRKHTKAVRGKTGLLLDPYFCATKLQWLLDNVKGARARAEKGELAFGTIDCWLTYCFTGNHVTDVTNASRTMLWEITAGHWDPELLDLFEVPDAVLPTVHPSCGTFGTADKKHLGAAIPITALVGDQQAALFGQGATQAGDAKNTYGTGCFLLQHTGADPVLSKHGLLTTRAATPDGSTAFALEGSVFVGGAAVQWLRDGLGLIQVPSEADKLAMEAGDAGDLVFVPAMAGLGAPHWDPAARGALLGITRGAGKAELARAVLQGIAHQCDDVLLAMEKDSGRKIPVLRVDGGATRSEPLLQFQADLLGRPVERGSDLEATALGAALLAGIGAGMWKPDVARKASGDALRYTPTMAKKEVKARRARWKKAVKAVRAYKP